MTEEAIKALPDRDLDQVIEWAQKEMQDRHDKQKRNTVLRIKELARLAGIKVNMESKRGRPKRSPSV